MAGACECAACRCTAGEREAAVAGQRTAVNLGGIEVAEIDRGQALATPGAITVTRRADAVLDLLPSAKPLKHGARVRFHQGTTEVMGRVSIAGSQATAIAPGSHATIRLRLESPVALTRGDRFILRAYSPTVTIGGGQVLDPEPSMAAIRTAAAAKRFEALVIPGDAAGDARALARMIADAGGTGLPIASLVSRAGVVTDRVPQVIASLESAGLARIAGDRLVSPALVNDLAIKLVAQVGEFHRTQPLADGFPREEARGRLFARADAQVFELVLNDLQRSGQLVVRDRLALPGHRLELSPEEESARTAVEAAYQQGGLKPPDAAQLAADAKLAPALVEKMSSLLLRQKRLVRVDTLIFHVDALTALKNEIRELKASAPAGRATVDVTAFKDRYGVSRKFAIPLLEWLDRERVTRRTGETRVVL